ncbi:MAG TPA: phage holin family protein [Gemmatimonadaceae bacterium]|nr:phage holin family protein [Gemmatimonadaceae bacterium]
MDVRSENGQMPPLGALLRDLAEGSSSLIRQELRLARLELTETLGAMATGATLIVSGSVFALLGGLSLLIGLILLGADQWLRDRYWLAALIVLAIAGALAVFFMWRGMALLSPKQLAPEQTVATLKEDTAWLKQRLTSGATSS